MYLKIGVVLWAITLCASQDASKWVWARNDNSRVVGGEKRYNGELASLPKPLFQASSNFDTDRRLENIKYRYEVTETTYPSDNTYRPRPPEQYRPEPPTNRPGNPYRPPVTPVDNYRPTNRPLENEYRPLGNGYRPPNGDYSSHHGLRPGVGTNGKPILTGPTPSWVDEGHHKYKDYDICKCVHSFNCNTPGIKFGSCDTDKQYCCYKSKQSEGPGSHGKPAYERPRPRPVLAGPGGPVDGFGVPHQDKRPYRPDRYPDPERELDEAYRKGLASAISELYQRPGAYYDRDPQGYKEYYRPERDRYTSQQNFKPSHPSKYGLYDPSGSFYARSANSSIPAISDSKN